MTPDERQALTNVVNAWRDLIKVLNSPEPVSETDPKLSDCDNNHIKYREVGIYLACPKCGEKL